jgi:hypothetical protein
MKNDLNTRNYRLRMNDRLDCFGDYFSQDPLCRKYCALRLRCAIERDRDPPYERYEDLGFPDVGLKVE